MTKPAKDHPDRFERLTRLSGTPIRDSQGELIGRVADLILDVLDARLAYVCIALLPTDGSDDRIRVTVPWSIVTLDGNDANGSVRVAVSRKTLMRIANTSSEG